MDESLRALEWQAREGDLRAAAKLAAACERAGRLEDFYELVSKDESLLGILPELPPENREAHAPHLARLFVGGVAAAWKPLEEWFPELAVVHGSEEERRAVGPGERPVLELLRPNSEVQAACDFLRIADEPRALAGLHVALERICRMQLQRSFTFVWYEHRAIFNELVSDLARKRMATRTRRHVASLFGGMGGVESLPTCWAGIAKLVEEDVKKNGLDEELRALLEDVRARRKKASPKYADDTKLVERIDALLGTKK